ncbi:hypothetical protein, partial [Enterobacter cloacae]|uniref:hypothetical protein n=1 Tax=Enterobacter cloacae TaxID=550 RepID=UPI000BE70738
PTISLNVNYSDEREKINDFLLFFKAPASRLASLTSSSPSRTISRALTPSSVLIADGAKQ